MKKYIFTILMAGVAFLFAGCSDDFGQGGSINAGDEISFGGRAGFELNENKKKAAATRTVYTGNTWTEADETGKTKTYEGVNWVKDDKVRIFSPQAVGINPADYTVSATNTEATDKEQHQVTLNKIGDGALQWSDATEYDFYAVYPSPHQYPLTSEGNVNETYAVNVLNGGTIVKGNIPAVQNYRKVETTDKGNYILHPRMEYAYMVARQKVTLGDKNAKDVYLNFVPIATAVEIEITNNSTKNEVELASILISSADKSSITGDFTADLSKLTDGNNDNSYTGVPESGFVEVGTDGNNGSQVTIATYVTSGTTQVPIKLTNGQSLKFTVFMLPTQNVDNLKITILGPTGNRNGTTTGITIAKHKKTYLTEMPLFNDEKEEEFDQSRWMTYLPNEAYIKGLSIPGAGGAASGNIYGRSTNNVDNYLEQSLSITDLWKQGIRCFEFTVDKVASGSLGKSQVICNNQPTELTLDNCVGAVTTLLAANPKEFAMVIITYQQSSGWNKRDESTGAVNQTRDPATFMSQLNDYWSGLTLPTSSDPDIKLEKKLYSTDLTVADARGKLFCIARPTSNGEDNYAEIETETWNEWAIVSISYRKINSTKYANSIATPNSIDDNILVIHGWGALKDKWYTRGFTECIYHRGNGWSEFTTAKSKYATEIGYNESRLGRPFDCSTNKGDTYTTLSSGAYENVKKTTDLNDNLNVNFYYSTIDKNLTVKDKGAWVQEWARVAQTTDTMTLKEGNNTYYVKWVESISEKKKHISDCLKYAINKSKGENTVYINSLCGYYITRKVPLSGVANSLTDFNLEVKTSIYTKEHVAPKRLSAMSNEAGMCGDIANFAKDINDYFYDLLLKTTESSSYVAGPMGIILMDRISADKEDNGSKIPSIIIANNFLHDLPSTATIDIPEEDEEGYDDEEGGDQWAKPAKRDAKSNSNSVIVWE